MYCSNNISHRNWPVKYAINTISKASYHLCSKTFPLVFLLLSPLLTYSQFQDKIPQVKPLPPDAAALFKVLERPIGTYTGTVPVQFPLFGVSSGPLSANLSLSYNSTGGIRVEEAASSVGLGFSFNDGAGRITQMVKGLPDDHTHGLLTNPTTPTNFTCTDMNDVYASHQAYELDLEPDIFMYNFNGQSGKFFFKEDGTIVMMQKTGIRIEYDQASVPNNGIRQWIITDEEGNKYYFGQNKAKTINYRLVHTYQYNSLTSLATSNGISSFSWYLTEAYDMNEENKITYTYQTSGGLFTTFSGGFMELYKVEFADCSEGYDTTPDQAVVQMDAGEYIVSRIDANDGYIKVNATADRQDGYGRKVNSVELYTPQNQIIKKYKFEYDYFNSSSSDPQVKRLKLKSFSEFGSSALDSLAHHFGYNEVYNMPSRLSPRTDYWGFYNGWGNSAFFPNIVFKIGQVLIRRNDMANKNARSAFAKTNVLTKITFPTGGYREFDYEGNTALTLFNPNEYHPDPSNSASPSFTRDNLPLLFDSLTQFFTVNSTDGGALFSYNATLPYPSSCGTFRVKLFKVNSRNQLIGGVLILDVYAGSYSYNLDNGIYRMEVYQGSPSCTVTQVYGTWTELTLSTGTVQTPHHPFINYNENNRPVGGVRVKEIRDYDPIADKVYKTQYRYKLYSTDSTLTSGLLISQPDLVTVENISGVGCRYYKLLPSSSYPLASEGGSYVVYPEVRTLESGNGWVDHIYSYAADTPPSNFPYVPPVDNSPYRGKLLEEKVYDQSGTLLKKTTHTYVHYGWQTGQGGLRVKAYWANPFPVDPDWSERPFLSNQIPTTAVCNWFELRGNAFDIRKTIDSTFTTDGIHVINTEYDYDFSYNDRLFLKRMKQTINSGDIRATVYNYSYSNSSNFTFGLNSGEITMKNDLRSKNYMLPLEVGDSLLTASGPNLLLGGRKFSFANINPGKIHLSRVRAYTNASTYIDLNLTSYSNKGRLQEQYRENDVKEAYLWGYNGQYPVAKVIGSDYTTISALVNNSILQSPSSSQQLRTELDKIRIGLANTHAQVTTYTYDRLVGMTSQTDPNGETTHYTYDDFNRLKLIKDDDLNILQRYLYHYKGMLSQ